MPKLEKISKKYGYRSVFDNFDLDIADNKVTVILGPSGVGKTTLLNALAGLISFDGSAIADKPISYIFQSPRLLERLTVKENLRFVLRKFGTPDDMIVNEMLDAVGLSGRENAFPRELSGGEKQRVGIARAFIYPSKTLLMDEPFTSLDFSLKLRLMQTFINLLKKSPKTVVFVTHDVDEALSLADEIVVLGANRVVYRKSLERGANLGALTGAAADEVRAELFKALAAL